MSFLFPKPVSPPPPPTPAHSPSSPGGFGALAGRPPFVSGLGTISALARKPAYVTKRQLYSGG